MRSWNFRVFNWLLLAGLAVSETTLANEKDLDVTFRTGASFGTLTFVNDAGTESSGDFGGVPMGVVWNRGFSKSTSFLVTGSVLLDMMNTQLIKQGFAGGVAWHLLGGPRRFMVGGNHASIVSYTRDSISTVVYGGLWNFAATDKENPKVKVAGSAFEVDLGIEYRHDFTEENSFTFEIATSVYTLPASTARLKPRSMDILFGWRTYI